MPIFPWIRKHVEAWAAGKSGKGIVAAPEKGNDFVPPCVLQVPDEAKGGKRAIAVTVSVVADIALLAVFILSCMSVVSGGYNPFIYFQF